jgi:DNA-binding winged helix-turn-helix (wHTH) protein/tetratricopeptide (TPR) repeat protein
MSPDQGKVYRFGEFAVDPLARTLKCEDEAVALTRRSFDLLLYLVQNAGRILSREELLKQIWPDTFVDENSLAKNVSVLRKALDDVTGERSFILTLPGRGYQFAAVVEIDSPPEEATLARANPVPEPRSIGILREQRTTRTNVTEFRLEQLPAAPFGRFAFLMLLLILMAGIVAAGLLLWRHFHPAPLSASVVLAGFENATGDKDFDFALNRAFQIELEQSPFLDILSRASVRETLTQMQLKADAQLTPELAREVCERNNAQAVLSGSLSRLADKYLLIVNANSCVTGKSVAGYKQQVSSKGNVLAALDSAAGHVRRQLGESAASLGRFQTPIAQATTSSLEALRAYTEALRAQDRGDSAAEQALFEKAISLDPNFASAYRGLSVGYNARQDYVQAISTIQKAWDLRAHTTERERLTIEIAYNTYGDRDWEGAVERLQLYNQIYPNDAAAWFSLSSMYSRLGEYPQAIEAAEHANRLAPHSGSGAETLARAYMRANRFAEAKRVAANAIAEGKDRWGTHRILYQIAYVEHDTQRMKTEGEWGFTHGQMGQSLTDLGFVAASEGKVREAIDDFTRARQEAVRSGDADFADDATMFLAGILIQDGYPREAADSLNQMRSDAIDPGTTAEFKAELGNLGPAQRQVAALSAGDPRNTLSRYFDLPMMRALLEIKEHKPAEAVKDIEPARKYQMRDYGVPYMRARAEADAGMLDKAAEDYRLILANPGLDPIWPGHSLAHFQLARVLARQNKLDQARAEYEAFLALWKDGDPQVPILIEARQEYAKLAGK